MGSVSFPGSIPPPRGMSYPTVAPPQGNSFSDIGKELTQNIGPGFDQIQKTMDAERDRQAALEEMVERRKMAIAAQRAKEEFQQKDLEFKQAAAEEGKRQFESQESRRVSGETRLKDKTDRELSEKDRIAEERAALNRELYEARKEKGKELDDDEVRYLAYAHGRGEEWEKFTKRRDPSNNYFIRGQEQKRTAVNSIPYKENQLYTAIKDFNQAMQKNFTSSILKKDFAGIDTEIVRLEKETEKRNALRDLLKKVRKKQDELDDAKIAAQMVFERDSNTQNISEEAQKILESINRSKAELESRGIQY